MYRDSACRPALIYLCFTFRIAAAAAPFNFFQSPHIHLARFHGRLCNYPTSTVDVMSGAGIKPYEPSVADLKNPVVEALTCALDSTQRAKRDYEVLSETQFRRLREKLARFKGDLRRAEDRVSVLEFENARLLCDAVLQRQSSQGNQLRAFLLSWMSPSGSARAPITQAPLPNYGLESAIQALVKASVFKRASPALQRSKNAYNVFFPNMNVDPSIHPVHRNPSVPIDDYDGIWDEDRWWGTPAEDPTA
ncbi:hypothetical protein C8F04DRAFT_1178333 [Mycena alexandri]|uniref:Uncharacterized protein n=1 Tax=Mycena alexandri TaxID=1745969 RepID=A0AAD6X7X6_9AGAR|nr:hypothetical protein C8F04DRAFT_1178333 [Mycena alexandri]